MDPIFSSQIKFIKFLKSKKGIIVFKEELQEKKLKDESETLIVEEITENKTEDGKKVRFKEVDEKAEIDKEIGRKQTVIER